jgi:hypothetical protein
MSNFDELYADLNKRFEPLSAAFPDSPEGMGGRKYFVENLEAKEFEIALHALCDFALEFDNVRMSPSVIDQIEELHNLMGLEDSCVSDLRSKYGRGFATLNTNPSQVD